MFSGIVEAVGTVVAASVSEEGGRLTIDCGDLAPGALGDSVAVNGVCLTVESLDATGRNVFQAATMLETLQRTGLGQLQPGARVNLERAVAANGRLGGHIVQGHIDGTAELVSVTPDGESLRLRYRPPARLRRYIVEKGFIAVDGASLTVTDVDDADGTFGVSLVRYTQAHTALVQSVGHHANIEVDILAKYVERLLDATRHD